jgi:hypothetical protein
MLIKDCAKTHKIRGEQQTTTIWLLKLRARPSVRRTLTVVVVVADKQLLSPLDVSKRLQKYAIAAALLVTPAAATLTLAFGGFQRCT